MKKLSQDKLLIQPSGFLSFIYRYDQKYNSIYEMPDQEQNAFYDLKNLLGSKKLLQLLLTQIQTMKNTEDTSKFLANLLDNRTVAGSLFWDLCRPNQDDICTIMQKIRNPVDRKHVLIQATGWDSQRSLIENQLDPLYILCHKTERVGIFWSTSIIGMLEKELVQLAPEFLSWRKDPASRQYQPSLEYNWDPVDVSDNTVDVSDNTVDVSDNTVDVSDNTVGISDNAVGISDDTESDESSDTLRTDEDDDKLQKLYSKGYM